MYLVRYTWNSVFLNSEGPEVANLIIVSLSYLTACTQEHLYNVLYRCHLNIATSTTLEINTKFAIFREKPGTKWKFRQCCRLWSKHFLLLDAQARLMALLKKGQIFIKIKSGRATLAKEKIYKCSIYHEFS